MCFLGLLIIIPLLLMLCLLLINHSNHIICILNLFLLLLKSFFTCLPLFSLLVHLIFDLLIILLNQPINIILRKFLINWLLWTMILNHWNINLFIILCSCLWYCYQIGLWLCSSIHWMHILVLSLWSNASLLNMITLVNSLLVRSLICF